ncbi:hypothetical protein NHQ30_008971 [Ciborinia camelliae]|nr:hypothetical protein NHQ30_008971 [Ciborinia camelliae]
MAEFSTSSTLITDPSKISLYNRGPILTTFIPPASCVSTLTFGECMYFGHQGESYVDAACYPSSTTEYGTGETAWRVYYYSPAFCPQGWSQAATLTSSFGFLNTQLQIGASTTVVVCCPSGFSYSDFAHACGSTFWSTTSKLLYINPSLDAINQWVATDANTPLTTMASGIPYKVLGDGIPVWWQASDLKAFSSAVTITSTSSLSTIQTLSIQTSAIKTSSIQIPSTSLPQDTTPPANTNGSSTGLSTGEKIAIGVITPLFILAITAGVAIYCIRKRQGTRARTKSRPPMNHEVPGQRGELGTEGAVSELCVGHEVRSSEIHGGKNIDRREVVGRVRMSGLSVERRVIDVDVGACELPG